MVNLRIKTAGPRNDRCRAESAIRRDELPSARHALWLALRLA